MKKIIGVILFLTILLPTITSCSDIFDSVKPPEYSLITIKSGDSEYSAQVEIGKSPHVDLPTKDKHICTGLYSLETGGTQYFDSNGDSTMIWQADFPTTLYARFESIVGQKFTSKILWDEDPNYIKYSGNWFKFNLSNDFINILESNSSLQVKITVYYQLSGKSNYEIEAFISSSQSREGTIRGEEFKFNTSNFTERTLTATCSAKQILNDNAVYFALKKTANELYKNERCKNVYCTVEITN